MSYFCTELRISERGAERLDSREGGAVRPKKLDSLYQRGSVRWYLLGVLVALELLMSFSFFGYLHVEPISITIAYIPVLLAGALLGPVDSMALGAVFGLASMWKATASYVMPGDQMFSPFMSGKPLESFLMSVGARTLFGLVIGVLFYWARKAKHKQLWVGVVSFFGECIHALFVYTVMFACFPEAGYLPSDALGSLRSVGGIVSNLLIAAVIYTSWHIQQSRLWGQFQTKVEIARSAHFQERYHWLSLIVIILVTVCSAVAVAFYFVHRIDYVLEEFGVTLDSVGYADMLHLQIQFMIGVMSLMSLVIVFLIFNRRYATYMNQGAKTDPLTGVLNRGSFFQTCHTVLQKFSVQTSPSGYFIMVDLDWLKRINDQYGHPEGDRALRELAQALQKTFGPDGLVGRVGGDEFAVLLCSPISREELETKLRHLQDWIHRIVWHDYRASCSIGVLLVFGPGAPEELYREADHLLYEAKAQGRDRYIIGQMGEAGLEISETPYIL